MFVMRECTKTSSIRDITLWYHSSPNHWRYSKAKKQLYLLTSACSAASDGGELLAAVPLRQPARLQRRVHEGNRSGTETSDQGGGAVAEWSKALLERKIKHKIEIPGFGPSQGKFWNNLLFSFQPLMVTLSSIFEDLNVLKIKRTYVIYKCFKGSSLLSKNQLFSTCLKKAPKCFQNYQVGSEGFFSHGRQKKGPNKKVLF